ncbi:MAG: T9SS C-terminal target domain-containing protein [Bacteroidetes bacterium]|nr:MAG: T9SS C-terminal target domain-containing protein [Bacteroidota bacterium]
MKPLILLFALVCAPFAGRACSYFISPFCEVVGMDTAAPVVRAVISVKNNDQARLQILEVWRGSVGAEIIMWELPNWDCNGALFDYSLDQLGEEGDTVWLVLQEYRTDWYDIPGATEDDFVTRATTTQHWVLKEEDGTISGYFDNLLTPNSMSYNNFISQLGNCADNLSASPQMPSAPIIQSRPDQSAIWIFPQAEGNVEAWITDMSGRKVSLANGSGESVQVSTAGLPAGIYVLYVRQNAWEGVKKVYVR